MELAGVNLSRTAVTNDGLLKLPPQQWQSLNLGETGIDDTAIPWLESCKKLSDLRLHGTRITGEALPRLANLTKLQDLSLPRAAFSARGMDYLAGLPKLNLYLEGKEFKNDAVREVAKFSPFIKMRVVFVQASADNAYVLKEKYPQRWESPGDFIDLPPNMPDGVEVEFIRCPKLSSHPYQMLGGRIRVTP
jgi:hypothetical protein